MKIGRVADPAKVDRLVCETAKPSQMKSAKAHISAVSLYLRQKV
jgi:hypothetical protein